MFTTKLTIPFDVLQKCIIHKCQAFAAVRGSQMYKKKVKSVKSLYFIRNSL